MDRLSKQKGSAWFIRLEGDQCGSRGNELCAARSHALVGQRRKTFWQVTCFFFIFSQCIRTRFAVVISKELTKDKRSG